MAEILAAVIGAVIGGALSAWITYRISYPMGITQGKQLVLHEKSVGVLTEIRKRLLALHKEWADWVSGLPDQNIERSKKVRSKLAALKDYHEENSFVLSQDMRGKIESLLEVAERKLSKFQSDLGMSRLAENEEQQRDARYRAETGGFKLVRTKLFKVFGGSRLAPQRSYRGQ